MIAGTCHRCEQYIFDRVGEHVHRTYAFCDRCWKYLTCAGVEFLCEKNPGGPCCVRVMDEGNTPAHGTWHCKWCGIGGGYFMGAT